MGFLFFYCLQLACELALKELRPDILLDVTVSVSEERKGFCLSQTNESEVRTLNHNWWIIS